MGSPSYCVSSEGRERYSMTVCGRIGSEELGSAGENRDSALSFVKGEIRKGEWRQCVSCEGGCLLRHRERREDLGTLVEGAAKQSASAQDHCSGPADVLAWNQN